MELSESTALVVPELQTLAELDALEQSIMAQMKDGKLSDELFEKIKFITMLRRASDFEVPLKAMQGLTLPQLITLVGGLEGIHTVRAAMRDDQRIRSILEPAVKMPPSTP